MKRSTLSVFIILALLSSLPGAFAEPKKDPEGKGPVAAVGSPAQPVSAFGNLARLGFVVFPDPQPIPDFSVRMLNGKKASLSDLKGKYVFLNFWATWCPPCQKEMPSIEEMHAKFGGKNFAVLAVSVREDQKTVEKFIASKKYTFPIALDPDGAVSALFVGRGIPTTYIIDPKGQAVAGMVGGREWNTAEVYEVLGGILNK